MRKEFTMKNTEYDFEAYFKDHFEADIFIAENEEGVKLDKIEEDMAVSDID